MDFDQETWLRRSGTWGVSAASVTSLGGQEGDTLSLLVMRYGGERGVTAGDASKISDRKSQKTGHPVPSSVYCVQITSSSLMPLSPLRQASLLSHYRAPAAKTTGPEA